LFRDKIAEHWPSQNKRQSPLFYSEKCRHYENGNISFNATGWKFSTFMKNKLGV